MFLNFNCQSERRGLFPIEPSTGELAKKGQERGNTRKGSVERLKIHTGTWWSGYWCSTGCVVQGRDMAADLDVLNLFVIAGATLAVPILAFVASVLLWPSALVKVYYW